MFADIGALAWYLTHVPWSVPTSPSSATKKYSLVCTVTDRSVSAPSSSGYKHAPSPDQANGKNAFGELRQFCK